MKNLFYFLFPVILLSCTDGEVQLQEMTADETLKAQELASIIQGAYNENQPDVVLSHFDALKFSKRVRIPQLRPDEKPPVISMYY